MTLTTRIAIVEPTSVREVFDECRRIIGAQGARHRHVENSPYRPGAAKFVQEAGQGFAALLWIYYGADAPLRPDPEYANDPEERDYYPPVDEWSIEVAFDTAYAYQGPFGGGCGDLHAWIIQQLGRWLHERDLSWYWYDEFNGAWHPGGDPATILGDPASGRLQAEPPPRAGRGEDR